MRGYSVLFVCALCMFVLCGAAAVVAQEATPEKVAAEAAKDFAKTATEKGKTALELYRWFDFFVYRAADALSTAIDEMNTTKRTADTLSLPGQVPSKEDIKEEIGGLQTAMTEVRNAVWALNAPDVDSLSNWGKGYEIRCKIKEVESKMRDAERAAAAVADKIPTIEAVITEAGELKATAFVTDKIPTIDAVITEAGELQAAAAVTDEIPTIDAVIREAGELQAAAEAAMTFWTAARGKLTAQLGEVGAAVAALNKIKNDIEKATKRFSNNKSPEIPNLNEQLTDISAFEIPIRVKSLIDLKSWLQKTKDAAEDAKNVNTALAAKANELKGKAEERKRKVQIQHRLLQLQLRIH